MRGVERGFFFRQRIGRKWQGGVSFVSSPKNPLAPRPICSFFVRPAFFVVFGFYQA